MPKLNKEDAIQLMQLIITDPNFWNKEKPINSRLCQERFGLTEKQQANIEVRLEKIYSYLIGE